jgi:ribonuclease P protein component
LKQTLPKREIIRSKKTIDLVFKKGAAIEEKPVKLLFIYNEGEPSLEVGFTVPKKYFKKACDRNLLRRRMKEAFRINKKNIVPFLEDKKIQLKIFFIYTSFQPSDYKTIEHKIIVLLQRLTRVIQ